MPSHAGLCDSLDRASGFLVLLKPSGFLFVCVGFQRGHDPRPNTAHAWTRCPLKDPLQNDNDQGSEGRRWSCGRPVCGSPGGTVPTASVPVHLDGDPASPRGFWAVLVVSSAQRRIEACTVVAIL